MAATFEGPSAQSALSIPAAAIPRTPNVPLALPSTLYRTYASQWRQAVRGSTRGPLGFRILNRVMNNDTTTTTTTYSNLFIALVAAPDSSQSASLLFPEEEAAVTTGGGES